jgi:hypothetical protein
MYGIKEPQEIGESGRIGPSISDKRANLSIQASSFTQTRGMMMMMILGEEGGEVVVGIEAGLGETADELGRQVLEAR